MSAKEKNLKKPKLNRIIKGVTRDDTPFKKQQQGNLRKTLYGHSSSRGKQ